MGTAELQGRLWGARPRAWAELQEAANASMYEAAFDAAGLSPGQHYLDIGCGAGLALSIAQRRGAKVSGLDAAAGLADLARARCPDADIRVGELEELPFADRTFDVVSGFNSFQYAADKVNGLAQAKRVMKEDGKLIVLVWGQPEECEMAGYLKALRGLLPPPPPGAPGPWALSPPGALEELASQAGLKAIHAQTVPVTFDSPMSRTRSGVCSRPGRQRSRSRRRARAPSPRRSVRPSRRSAAQTGATACATPSASSLP